MDMLISPPCMYIWSIWWNLASYMYTKYNTHIDTFLLCILVVIHFSNQLLYVIFHPYCSFPHFLWHLHVC